MPHLCCLPIREPFFLSDSYICLVHAGLYRSDMNSDESSVKSAWILSRFLIFPKDMTLVLVPISVPGVEHMQDISRPPLRPHCLLDPVPSTEDHPSHLRYPSCITNSTFLPARGHLYL